jgi:glycosyltransferase involved in cell wall biosynthesis
MRIAFVSTILGTWGGSEELWAAAARAARREGDAVAAAVWDREAGTPQAAELARLGVRLLPRRRYGLGRLARAAHRLFDPFRALRRFRPDVVCISQGSTYDCVRLSAYARLLEWLELDRVPHVVLSHGNLPGHAYLPEPHLRPAAARLFDSAYRVAFVAERLRRVAEIQMARSLPNAIVIRNPVALPDRSIVSWPPEDGPARLACVGRLDAYVKGYDLLLEALQGFAADGAAWRLRLYGEGPDRGYLQGLASYLGLSDRVELAGHAPDIREVWAGSHLLVLTSRTEGVPLGLVEAMLCGRPSVVTDVGGVGEWIAEPETGFVAPSPTVPAIREALVRAFAARGRWRAIGRAAHETAAPRIGDPGADLLRLLREAAAGRGWR